MNKYFLILFFCLAFTNTDAQEISFKDTIAAYNSQRIHTNKTGMLVLGGWGIANMAASGAGYFMAKNREWMYFHEMNVIWGVVNTGIAAFGLAGVRKESAKVLNYNQAYDRYRANKRLYLLNAGLDVLYIGAGVGMHEYGKTLKDDKAIFMGFGKSFVIQGVFLLLFDNVMFAAHHRSNSKWFEIMNELHFTGNGIGFTHNF